MNRGQEKSPKTVIISDPSCTPNEAESNNGKASATGPSQSASSEKELEGNWGNQYGLYFRSFNLSPNHLTNLSSYTCPNTLGPPGDTDAWSLHNSTIQIELGVHQQAPSNLQKPLNRGTVPSKKSREVLKFNIKEFHGYKVLVPGDDIYSMQFNAPHEILFGLWKNPEPKTLTVFWRANQENMRSVATAFKKKDLNVCFISWTFLFQSRPAYYIRDPDYMKFAYPESYWQEVFRSFEFEKNNPQDPRVQSADWGKGFILSSEQVEKVVEELITAGLVHKDSSKTKQGRQR